MHRVRRLAVLATATVVSVGTAVLGAGGPACAVPNSKAPATGKKADFNGDGYGDIAIGVMQESISGVRTTGAVTVLRGSSKGLTGTGSVSWHQNTAGVPGVNEPYDMFGTQISLVDMNGDGRSELAVGTRSENITEGNVWYFKSGSAGLTTSGVVSIGPKTVGLTAKYRAFGGYLVK
ncbi:FG-GAP repeat protein [Streptomyces sp. NPDC005728]|uniref:FG-GAP repeat domain-containing protein n=1 Tax=Streptomyces sp. NPDC005728 TaxID=3157054 RepID=UPI00340B7CEC